MFVIYPAEELLRIYESHPCHVVASGFAPLNDPRSVEKGQRISEEDAKDVERRRCVDDKSSGNQGKSGNPATQKYSKAQKKSNRGKKRLWWFAKKHSNEKKTLNCSTSVDDRPTVCDSNRKNNDNINDNKVDNTKNNNKETKGSADPGKRGANSKVKGGNASSSSKSSSSPRRKTRDCAIMQNNRNTADEAAANAHPTINNPLKDLTQANLNEPLKQHNGNALKLVQTVSEFAQELSAVMESHGANVRRLVEEFRGKSGESTRGDSGGMRRVWENLLRQVEADASAHLDLAAVLQHQLARPTLESSFHRKIQSRKIFGYREAYEQVVIKSEEKLQRARVDYKRAYAALLTSGDTIADQEPLRRAYLESHNAYVLQLRATNAIVERYQHHCLPTLLGEISEVYEEVCSVTCNCIAGISEASAERAGEQAKRYTAIGKEAQTVAPANDLQIFARNLASTATPKKPPRRLFVAPSPPEQISVERLNQVPSLRDEIVTSGSANQTILEDLKRDADGLNQEIGRLQDALDALLRMQRKSAEGSLFTKVAELQEDISIKRFDLGVAYLHLAAVQAQKELFGAGEAGQPDPVSNRKMSNGSTGSNTKHKWLKAFKSLKTSSPTTPPPVDKKTLESEGGHQWREYTYRKITPCDACGQVLRGHISQGFRCRRCKVNAHADCINSVQPSVCPSLVPKKGGGIPLLRRQKTSAPPVEDAPSAEHNVDATYQVLKQAGEIRGNSTNSPPTPPVVSDQPGTVGPPSTTRTSSHPCSSSTSGRGSGGSASGTRPFGQPLMLKLRVEEPPKPPTPTIVTVSRSSILCSVSRSPSLSRNRRANKRR